MSEVEERRPERGRLPGDRYVRIVRPFAKELRRTGRDTYEVTERALEPEGGPGRALELLRRVVIGRRLRTEMDIVERVSKKTGLALFASDNISSSAYATEQIMRVLALAGIGALDLTEPVTLAVIAVMALVVFSELRVIRAYPQGGGSYQVASENLGPIPGLVAGSALLIDYTLTIAVSVSAGVAALSSAYPPLHEHRVTFAVVLIAFLTLMNLRGVREAGLVFMAPTYLYLLGFFGLIAYGLLRAVTGTLPSYLPPPEWAADWQAKADLTGALTALLVLRAFSSGAVALTGTEAIANTVPAFKPPEARNAGITLVVMGACFASIFGGLSLLAGAMGVVPHPDELETVNSQVARTLLGGDTPYYYYVQGITMILLLLAANTSFTGFPRLASILARDRFLPRQFAYRGDRLAYSFGIVVVALAASLILAAFRGSVEALIPLYTIGVFVAFTLSQTGLVRRWRRLRSPGWRPSMAINAVGATATAIVLVIVAVTKFEHGAWMVLLAMPLIVGILYGIHRHYRAVEDALVITEESREAAQPLAPVVVVPISRLDRAAVQAVAFARSLSGDVSALHVSDDSREARTLQERWQRLIGDGVPLKIVESPYRVLMEPLLTYLDAIDRHDSKRPVTVVLAEFVPRHWWEYMLHNQTALWIKLRLFFRPNTVVVDVPYHVGNGRL